MMKTEKSARIVFKASKQVRAKNLLDTDTENFVKSTMKEVIDAMPLSHLEKIFKIKVSEKVPVPYDNPLIKYEITLELPL